MPVTQIEEGLEPMPNKSLALANNHFRLALRAQPQASKLTESEKAQIRARIEKGESDIYQIAAEFGCSASQVAGIKAHLKQ